MATYIVCHSDDAEDVEIVHDVDLAGWDGVECCYVCGEVHDPATCGLCDRCGDYHLAEMDCAPGRI